MRYLIIDHFRKETSQERYQRFNEKGRLTPVRRNYIDSWIAESLNKY